jgi:hypothetical protein
MLDIRKPARKKRCCGVRRAHRGRRRPEGSLRTPGVRRGGDELEVGSWPEGGRGLSVVRGRSLESDHVRLLDGGDCFQSHRVS